MKDYLRYLIDFWSTSMTVSYAQVYAAAVVMLGLLAVTATLLLWLYDLERMLKNSRAIERHLSETVERLDEELHCCKRALGRRTG